MRVCRGLESNAGVLNMWGLKGMVQGCYKSHYYLNSRYVKAPPAQQAE